MSSSYYCRIFDVIQSEVTLQKASALDFLFLFCFYMKLQNFLNMEISFLYGIWEWLGYM